MNYKEYAKENRELKKENKMLKTMAGENLIYLHNVEKQNRELIRENHHLTEKLKKWEVKEL